MLGHGDSGTRIQDTKEVYEYCTTTTKIGGDRARAGPESQSITLPWERTGSGRRRRRGGDEKRREEKGLRVLQRLRLSATGQLSALRSMPRPLESPSFADRTDVLKRPDFAANNQAASNAPLFLLLFVSLISTSSSTLPHRYSLRQCKIYCTRHCHCHRPFHRLRLAIS